jgi:phenylacetate-CoA ligase
MNFDSSYKLVYLTGSAIRRTPVPKYLRRLLRSQWWDFSRHIEVQLKKTRKLLVHASHHSSFYAKYFKTHGVDPEITSLDDMKNIPPLDKSALLPHIVSIQNKGLGNGLIFSETSGTSGQPLKFHRDLNWDTQHRAAILRGLSWYKVRPWMLSGKLWGITAFMANRWKTRIEDLLLHRFRQKAFDLSPETLEHFYQKLRRAKYLEGYSSMIFELARHINDNHRDDNDLHLKLVKGTSEKIFPHYQSEALSAFGQKMVSEYGAAEAGIIAFECPAGQLHVNMDHVLVEVEEGEILITNLLSFSFPIVRYRLGDYTKLKDDTHCPCGRQSLIIEDISGRVGQPILGLGGEKYPSLTIYYILKSMSLRGDSLGRCQAIQKSMGQLEFNVVLRQNLSISGKKSFEKALGQLVDHYYKGSMIHRVNYVEDIPRDNCKTTDFISEIDEKTRY